MQAFAIDEKKRIHEGDKGRWGRKIRLFSAMAARE